MRSASQPSVPHKIQQGTEQFAPILTRERKLSHSDAARLESLAEEHALPRINHDRSRKFPGHHGDRILDVLKIHRQSTRGSPGLQILDHDEASSVISPNRGYDAGIVYESKV
jgi:hypothetical protein